MSVDMSRGQTNDAPFIVREEIKRAISRKKLRLLHDDDIDEDVEEQVEKDIAVMTSWLQTLRPMD